MIQTPSIKSRGLFIHSLDSETISSLSSCFTSFAFSEASSTLPAEDLAEVLLADDPGLFVIGGSVNFKTQSMTLWKGDLKPLTVPFNAFKKSGDATMPDFHKFTVKDCGQTIALGHYEAAVDALMSEFDR